MPQMSAGILPYRWRDGQIEILLALPGGPYWRNRHEASWSVIKGECIEREGPEDAARREFEEETGWPVNGSLHYLGKLRQAGGKQVKVFALEANFDPKTLVSNRFTVEWPPKSGVYKQFPELDKAEWLSLRTAERMILPSQRPALRMLLSINGMVSGEDPSTPL